MFVPIIVIFLIVLVGVSQSAKVVPPGNAFIVERLGRFDRVLFAGFHILVPFFERIAKKISTQDQVINIKEYPGKSKDGVPVKVQATICYKVLDPQKAYAEVADYVAALGALAETMLRVELQLTDLNGLLGGRTEFDQRMTGRVSDGALKWGIAVKNFETLSVIPPEDVVREIEKQAQVERATREATKR